jgi:hypothetical protein
MIKLILTILTIFATFSISCFFHSGLSHPGRKGYLEIQVIPFENESARVEKFQSFPINQQLEIYLFSNEHVEGGGGDISKYVSTNFETKLPFIVEKIKTSERVEDKLRLFGLFSYPNTECLRKHPEIIPTLSEAQPQITKTDSEETKQKKQDYMKLLSNLKEYLNN